MRRVLARALLATLLAPAAIAVAVPVAAAAPPTVSAPVRIEATLVRASRGASAVDPALGAIAGDLRALPYTKFERVDGTTFGVAPGGRGEAHVRDVRVVVGVDRADASGVTLQVEVWRGDRRVTSTTVERPFGRAHVVSVGTDGSSTLLVPIRALR
jgi:hypothetical protein